jgi:hypothetical protein
MLNESILRNRTFAHELRCLAFKQVPAARRRKAQLMALATGFDRFADRDERTNDKIGEDDQY